MILVDTYSSLPEETFRCDMPGIYSGHTQLFFTN